MRSEVEYGLPMSGILRRGLVFILAAALIAGGLPIAHAMPCASPANPAAATHQHDGMQMAAGADHMHAYHIADAAPQSHRDHHGKMALDGCKCLNCGMCAIACVEPLVRGVTPNRLAYAVRYLPAATGHPTALASIDPGIPIAIA
jgi:ferredoxin-like protein FixX